MPRAHANGIEIEYEEFGDRNGRPLLLIMGLGAQMILWHEDLCEALASRGFRVIRFDNRDVGKTTWFDHLGVPDIMSTVTAAFARLPINAPYLLKDMAADAIGLLDALNIDKAHIVGASMGGMIAQTVAIEFPARVLSLTSIMSTTGNPDLPQAKPDAMGVLLAPPPTTREEAIARGITVFRTIGSPGFPFDEADVRDRATRSFERGFNPAGTMRQLVAILASGSRTEKLRAVKVPTLVIHGKDDPLVPLGGGQDTAGSIPGAELMVVEGMGHDMPTAVRPRIVEAISTLAARA
ncbi:MAG TPA: alpha/beta hydrolase [Candidatus Acidoferrales bacterium]|nr:alpha/beta hydrolase [Candidatus Acidoferrales bacterium]